MLRTIKFLFILFITTPAIAGSITNVEIPEQYDRWTKDNANIMVGKEMTARVNSIIQHTESAEWKQKQAEYKATMKKALGFEEDLGENDLGFPVKDRVVLFISETIPMHVLRTYARDIAKVDGIMVLRGMKGGVAKLQPTVQLIGDIIKVDPNCHGPKCKMLPTSVIIDPILFRENQISKVPAAIFQPNMEISSYCERDSTNRGPMPSNHIVYGDASLVGILKELQNLHNDPKIQPLIEKLGG